MKTVKGDEARLCKNFVPVMRKTLKMSDGIRICVSIFECGTRRVAAFLTADALHVRDSVLFEVFLLVGGEVCAYSRLDGEYRIKLFSPLD